MGMPRLVVAGCFCALGAQTRQIIQTKPGTMNFIADKQTLDDLHIFGKRSNAIYQLFNTTQTRGEAQLLEEMFMYPLSTIDSINRRSAIIQYFRDRQPGFPFRSETFDAVEQYLENADERTKIKVEDNTIQRKLRN